MTDVKTGSIIVPVQVTSTPGTAKLGKMSICYSGRIGVSACRTYVAQHFDLAAISNGYPTDAKWVKDNAASLGGNPNIKILNYYELIFGPTGNPDNWYIHAGGNVVNGSGGQGPVMNPTSGWANYYIQRAVTLLNSYPVFDGIFMDDLWYDPTYDNSYWSSSPSNWDMTMTNWKSAIVTFMGNVKSALGSKIAMGNMQPPSAAGVIGDQTKCVILEHFVHKLETSVTENGRPVQTILDTIGYLHSQAVKGNLIVGLSGCSSGTGYEDWAKFCWACLAFAAGPDVTKSYFAWNFMGSSPTTNPTWYSWMDTVIGNPVDEFHVVSGYVYAREFQNYYIIANLDVLANTKTFTFNGNSYVLQGKHALLVKK